MNLLSVGDLTAVLRELLELNEGLRDLWVAGEIAEFKRYAQSGHCYFSLKDERSSIRGVMWRTYAERHSELPRNGDAVLAHGRVAIYEARGELQFVVDTIVPAGAGILNARFEELKRRLGAEGLFDESRKRPLPALPRRIGIVTSPQAAALQDMLNVLRRRFPLVEVILSPCLVQGERAPDSIVEALYNLYDSAVDVIILARGGGAADDLWAFNDESVARAVFASPVPLVTGVGHETDYTIVDYVADVRAPTPSAAAEVATPELAALAALVADQRARLDDTIAELLSARRADLETTVRSLGRLAPLGRVAYGRQQVDELSMRMQRAVARRAELARAELRGLLARLEALSPRAVLGRGYAVVRRADGRVLTAPAQAAPGERLRVTLRDGDLAVVADPSPTEEPL